MLIVTIPFRFMVAGFLQRERAASPRVFAGLSDTDALLTMGVLAKSGDELRPTLAGVMALGRHPQRFFPRANITFAVFPGLNREELSQDGARFIDSRTIIGSIPVMVSEALAGVRRNMKVASFIENGARRDVAEYPELAIREAVANALMHRDYSPEGLGSQVQINMFSDRIEIMNPGGLYGTVTVDNIGEYGASSSRNQYLSRILESTPYPEDVAETGYVVENKGTGYAQMQASLRANGLPAAEPEDSLSMFVLRIYKKVEAQKSDIAVSFSGANAAILNLIDSLGAASSSDVAEALNTSAATAYRRLKKLVDEGVLGRIGSGRNVRYVRKQEG